MKRIIDGRKYDTDTAEYMGGNMYSYPGDFHYWCEGLYRKKNGEFFLHGEGGPMSRYSEALGNNCWGDGEDIIPLTEEEAREWAEKNLSADTYEEIFGEVEE